jgi:hypothetical protein
MGDPKTKRLGDGITYHQSYRGEIAHNTVWKCGFGIRVSGSLETGCRDNLIADNRVGVRWHEGGPMDYNCLWNNRLLAIVMEKKAETLDALRSAYRWKGARMEHGFIADPELTDPGRGDFSLAPSSPCRKAASDGTAVGARWEQVRDAAAQSFDRAGWLRRLAAARCARRAEKEKKNRRVDRAVGALNRACALDSGNQDYAARLAALKAIKR